MTDNLIRADGVLRAVKDKRKRGRVL
ncbi:hypothetical protein MNBD_ALPHA07-2202, partial [hydrothermal vent metagenome]